MDFCILSNPKSLPDPKDSMSIDHSGLHQLLNSRLGLPRLKFDPSPKLQIDIEMTDKDWEDFQKHSDQMIEKMLHDIIESGMQRVASYENGHKVIEITDYTIYEEGHK